MAVFIINKNFIRYDDRFGITGVTNNERNKIIIPFYLNGEWFDYGLLENSFDGFFVFGGEIMDKGGNKYFDVFRTYDENEKVNLDNAIYVDVKLSSIVFIPIKEKTLIKYDHNNTDNYVYVDKENPFFVLTPNVNIDYFKKLFLIGEEPPYTKIEEIKL